MTAAVLAALRDAFSERPDWRGFSPHHSEPAEDFDVETALPFALEDREGAA